MTEFHLQARLIIGPLARPERNETRLAESDNWQTIHTQAVALANAGFTVWIFRAEASAGAMVTSHDLRLVTTILDHSPGVEVGSRPVLGDLHLRF